MATLVVNYRELSSVTGTAKKILSRYEKRIEDYEGIKRKISSISGGGRNNLSQANYFLQKKSQKLQKKKETIDRFITSVNRFSEEAKAIDKRVANRIKDDFKSFKKANDLETTFVGFLEVGLEDLAKLWLGDGIVSALKRGGRNIKYQIKDWYHDKGGKYIVSVVVDAAAVIFAVGAVVAAVATGAGVLAIFFAGFAVYNSASDYYYDVQAATSYYLTGDTTEANRLAKKGGKDITRFWSGEAMALIAGVTGQNVDEWREAGKAAGGIVYTGVATAAILYGIFTLTKTLTVGNDFKFTKFYKDLGKNENNLTFGQILLENSGKGSLAKMIKDYKTATSLADDLSIWQKTGVVKQCIKKNLFFTHTASNDSTLMKQLSDYKKIKALSPGLSFKGKMKILGDISATSIFSGEAYIWKKNYKVLKSIIKGDNTYNLPKRIDTKIKDIYKNINEIKTSWNGYMQPKAIDRIRPLTAMY